MLYKWKWVLRNGDIVRAKRDTSTGEDSVWIGDQLVSRSTWGPDSSHSFKLRGRAPADAQVTFDPATVGCMLVVDGDTVAPTNWPGRPRHAAHAIVAPRSPRENIGAMERSHDEYMTNARALLRRSRSIAQDFIVGGTIFAVASAFAGSIPSLIGSLCVVAMGIALMPGIWRRR